MKKYLLGFSIVILSFSCATKKQVNYLQDIDKYQNTELHDTAIKIQPKDILNISITTLMPEIITAIETPPARPADEPLAKKAAFINDSITTR